MSYCVQGEAELVPEEQILQSEVLVMKYLSIPV